MDDTSIRHLICPTRLGLAAVIYRQRPFALIKILLPRKDRETLFADMTAQGFQVPGSHEQALVVKKAITDYFGGKPIPPFWEWLDLSGITSLQQSVLAATCLIPYGELRSYKDIAAALRRPRAYRFVGTALARNPFPILIPCHRVIRSDHTLGRFGGGTDLKRNLLELEALHQI